MSPLLMLPKLPSGLRCAPSLERGTASEKTPQIWTAVGLASFGSKTTLSTMAYTPTGSLARTGTVVTAIQGRDYARIYVKDVERGTASVALSPEEQTAVERAMAR